MLQFTASNFPNKRAHKKAIRQEIARKTVELNTPPLDSAEKFGQRLIIAKDYCRKTIYHLKCLLNEI